jgi:methionyl-tRNA formyltransferase
MLKIIFMGTPIFAVPSLDALHKSEHEILACVTAPDRPAGRGRKLQSSEVKNYCIEHNIKVLQPTNLKDPDFIDDLKALQADVIIVVAFRMLPEAVWSIPPKGTINLHASLLPDYRGAAPINRAIMNGETVSGLSTFFINDKIDTGDILLQEEMPIEIDDTFETLRNKMMAKGADLLLKTLQNLDAANSIRRKQNTDSNKTAPKLNRENTEINWKKSSAEIYNHIRGLSPYPAAWTRMVLKGETIMIKIQIAEISENTINGECGSYRSTEEGLLEVICGTGSIKILRAQIQGKKPMNMDEILRGYKEDFLRGRFIY